MTIHLPHTSAHSTSTTLDVTPDVTPCIGLHTHTDMKTAKQTIHPFAVATNVSNVLTSASFSMHGQALVTRHYIDDTRHLKHGEQDGGSERTSRGGERGEHVTWTRSEIEELVRDARAGAHKYYGVADSHLFRALSLVGAKWSRDTHTRKLVSGHLSGKKVAVISIGHAADKTSGAWYDVC